MKSIALIKKAKVTLVFLMINVIQVPNHLRLASKVMLSEACHRGRGDFRTPEERVLSAYISIE